MTQKSYKHRGGGEGQSRGAPNSRSGVQPQVDRAVLKREVEGRPPGAQPVHTTAYDEDAKTDVGCARLLSTSPDASQCGRTPLGALQELEANALKALAEYRRCLAEGLHTTGQMVVCGLEGMPGSGKTSVCRLLSPEIISDYAGIDVGPQGYPRLQLDPARRHRISIDSVFANRRFFTTKEMVRTKEMLHRYRPFYVLDRTWISQVIHAYALARCLGLPKIVIEDAIDDVEQKIQQGSLYAPHWLVMFAIPIGLSVRKTVRRDGDFFSPDMKRLFTRGERLAFHAARADAYKKLQQTHGIPVVVLSYKAHPRCKLEAVMFPPSRRAPNWQRFFETLRERLLSEQGPMSANER